MLSDKGYDADSLGRSIRQAEAMPVILGRSSRKRKARYDRKCDKDRHLNAL